MITIRKATIDDVLALSKLAALSIVESHGHSAPAHIMQAYIDEKLTEAALRIELEEESNVYHLLHYKGQLAGYSKILYNVSISAIAEPNITKMERLYLLKEFYGLKLGHQLMQFNIDIAKSANQVGIWLYVWKENHRALQFYERTGFTIVGDGFFRLTEDHANPNWQLYLPFS